MSRLGTLHRSTDESVSKRVQRWADETDRLGKLSDELSARLEAMEQAKLRTAEDLSRHLAPVATAMASLVEETRQTMEHLRRVAQDERRHAEAARRAAEGTLRKLVELVERTAEPSWHRWMPTLFATAVPTATVTLVAWRAGLL
jgi:hypothetical protein